MYSITTFRILCSVEDNNGVVISGNTDEILGEHLRKRYLFKQEAEEELPELRKSIEEWFPNSNPAFEISGAYQEVGDSLLGDLFRLESEVEFKEKYTEILEKSLKYKYYTVISTDKSINITIFFVLFSSHLYLSVEDSLLDCNNFNFPYNLNKYVQEKAEFKEEDYIKWIKEATLEFQKNNRKQIEKIIAAYQF